MSTESALYIGLMSGTSADGIDVAIVDYALPTPKLIESDFLAYSDDVRQKIVSLYQPGNSEIDQMGNLHVELAHLFANAISTLLSKAGLSSKDIVAIGSHGQTIRHRPELNSNISHPFTLQIGCDQTLAVLTNIKVIGQFRQKDIALGGQGAPLVPAFHQAFCSSPQSDVFIVNIGGIANITYLPCNSMQSVIGFDTGPGNALLDLWFQQHKTGRFDDGGKWGIQGEIDQALLDQMLADVYFKKSPPKSTGREYFTSSWLSQFLVKRTYSPIDVQACLAAVTATTIANEIKQLSTKANVYLCGGGANNNHIVTLLKQQLNNFNIEKSDAIHINEDIMEAMAFSWLAYAYDKNIFSNIPAVTGARKETVLGVCFNP